MITSEYVLLRAEFASPVTIGKLNIDKKVESAITAFDIDLKKELEQIIAETGASSPADMGKVMGAATKKLAGRADGKAISAAVKELLAK